MQIDPRIPPAYGMVIMLRRLHLLLAALAMLIAPVVMQSGVAMAAMPSAQGDMMRDGHCGESAPDQEKKAGAMMQCCVAMCTAITPFEAAVIEPMGYHAPLLFGLGSAAHRPFITELPTPPPRAA